METTITMCDALEFYAEAANWIPQDEEGISAVDRDEGEAARDALYAKDIGDGVVLGVLKSVEYVPRTSPTEGVVYACPVCHMSEPRHGLGCAMEKALRMME